MSRGFSDMRQLRHLKTILAIGFAAVVFSGSARADATGDLTKLLRDYLEAEQKLRPSANERNDDRYDEKLLAANMAARRRTNDEMRARLTAIDPFGLKPQDELSYEIFHWALDDEQRDLRPGIAEHFQLLPLNQFDGQQITFPRQVQWRPDNPWNRPKDYDDAIRRMLAFTHWVDRAIAYMREGMKEGVVQPRAIVRRVIAQTESLAARDPEESLFMEPIKNMPGRIAGKDRARILDAYREAVAGQLIPAYRRLREFLKTEYLPQARDSIGLSAIPGGKDMYLYLVKSETTSDLSPDEIHAIGLAELTRIEADMERVKNETGFSGSLDQFREFLHSDPRFKFKDSAAMLAEFNRVKNIVSDRLGALFATRPKMPLAFRFYDAYAASDKPAAEYAAGSADGRRPGVVYLNASDLAERPTYTTEVLELHEGLPGHHLQMATTLENSALPRFRRFGEETAFAEGWALYAETLGPDLGLYTDPYQKFGALSFDAWRASRLVVDTGIHWLNWNREQSVQFLMSHTALSKTEADEEVDRYIAIPAQALAYKIGEGEILDLRERAKAALGAKFDLKLFHEAVLKDGAMPLAVLDIKIGHWIEQEKKA